MISELMQLPLYIILLILVFSILYLGLMTLGAIAMKSFYSAILEINKK